MATLWPKRKEPAARAYFTKSGAATAAGERRHDPVGAMFYFGQM
jgi:hypothetical protein